MKRNLPFCLTLLSTLACLVLVAADVSSQKADPQRWGLPDGGQVAQPELYGIACYSGWHRSNRYVMEVLTATSVSGEMGDRKKSHFAADHRWPEEFRASLSDYAAIAETHDRGHIAACDQHRTSQKETDATFLLSNIGPQHAQLNRGLWKQLEMDLRKFALTDEVDKIWVCSFPLFMPEDAPAQGTPGRNQVCYELAGPNHVPIPTHWGKACLFQSKKKEVSLRAWIFPNKPPPALDTIDNYRVSTDYAEHWSGLDFWADLHEPLQLKLEAMR